jgi:acetyltransferase-like isoleucine patch superfamily enzyme
VREAIKVFARSLAVVAVAPMLFSYAVRRRLQGDTGAFEASTQALALVPGLAGQYVRRAFLARTAQCAASACVQFGALFSDPRVWIGERVYIGPRCQIGWAHLEQDVLLASGVHIPSGPATHGIDDLDRPIRDQPGARVRVRVGQGTWIGDAAVIMADVGAHCAIGAGSVVTRPIPDYSVAAGVPARVLRSRRPMTQVANFES